MNAQDLPRRIAEKMFAQDRYSQHLGIELLQAEADYSLCRMVVDTRHLNGHGGCHGGAIFSLADTVFAHICNADNRVSVGHICTIAYWRGAAAGDVLYAKAEGGNVFGRSGSYRIGIHLNAEDGELIAEFQGFSRALNGRTHFPD